MIPRALTILVLLLLSGCKHSVVNVYVLDEADLEKIEVDVRISGSDVETDAKASLK